MAVLKESLHTLKESGKLSLLVNQSRDPLTNPLLGKNLAGYSGWTNFNMFKEDFPELSSALLKLRDKDLTTFSLQYIRKYFGEEEITYGSHDLSRLNFIEANIYREVFGKLFSNNFHFHRDLFEIIIIFFL